MCIICLRGGLGNQMFQYSFGYSFSKKTSATLKLDISCFKLDYLRNYELGLYNIIENFATSYEINKLTKKSSNLVDKTIRKLVFKSLSLNENFYKESGFNFDGNVFNTHNNTYFDGYWQSEKYFNDYRDDLLTMFSLKENVHYQTKKYQHKICDGESVSLHIRRGDYISDTKANNILGICPLDYYKTAVLAINDNIDNPHYYIFSDDIDWTKENIDFIDAITFVELAQDIPDHEEMWLMSQCQHNIIANSSFSWWGAWLNQNPEKIVIAPQRWFMDTSINTDDLIPESWVRL